MSLRIPRFLCGMKQSPSTVLRISRLLRRGVYLEPVEGLLAKTFFGFLGTTPW